MTIRVERVAVIGTGLLGTQIAMLSAYAGYKVSVYDTRDGAFDEIYQKLYADFKAKGIKPFIPWDHWEKCKTAITFTTHLADALQDVDLVIEAVTEDVEAKRNVFRQLGKTAPAKAIFASNSSSLPISRMEESSGRPERCINTHFYGILQGMNMTDLMAGTKTLPEVMEAGEAWIRSLGCIPLGVKKEILGFCFNSVWRAIKKQCLYMWANGFVDFRDIDRAWRIFTGMKTGPFGRMDSVGLDTVYNIEMVYYNESKDPKDKPPEALMEKIKRGELGIKTGKGFYTYPNPEFLDPDFLNPKK
ncbi:MAG TPA: 3-hydroxyacyl-CoA dehydrogenase NAD-binding domain-containing protein [Thermodesulfobacteriota bacterium]|nr:3-hydroxyacyl-CoA dehydrogenase NAD-binding domain-containing protein [Thermodesulfobacteriota bacterium]